MQGGSLLLSVFYIEILYTILNKLHLKYNFLRFCLCVRVTDLDIDVNLERGGKRERRANVMIIMEN